MPLQCNKGCLAKRKCHGGDAWLIRFHGRIMYEQRSRMFTQVQSEREGKKEAAIVLSLLILSLPTASSTSSSSPPRCQFLLCMCTPGGYLGSLVTLCPVL